jgi:hypothetical protein
MRAIRGWLVTLLAALVVAAGATGCGIPVDSSPEPLDFPPQYQSPTSSSAPPEATTPGQLTAMLCLTRDQRLVPIDRPVETPQSAAELLADLIGPVTEAESQQGLSSALAGIRGLTVAGIENGIAEVAVGDSLDGITGNNQLLIYGQIVCTLDAHPAVAGVWFSRDDQPLPVPRGNATVTEDVLTADDYTDLLEPT